MGALVFIEADQEKGGRIRQASRSAIAAAQKFGTVDVVVFGPQGADHAARLPGIRKVIHCVTIEHLLAEPVAAFLAEISSDYSHIVAASTSVGKNILPRLAGLLDVQPVSDVMAIRDHETFVRPIYAGNALATVRSHDRIKLLTIRGAAFDPVAEDGGNAPTEVKAFSPSAVQAALDGRVRLVRVSLSSSDRPELETARIVISGGKGLKDAAQFESVLTPLAEMLGAAIGASRAAVDSGFAPNEIQVGQTGKIIAPELYIAVGLSGALQHLAGMKDSRVIVAINIDPDAPIFKIADYGLVGDLFEILPKLQAALQAG